MLASSSSSGCVAGRSSDTGPSEEEVPPKNEGEDEERNVSSGVL